MEKFVPQKKLKKADYRNIGYRCTSEKYERLEKVAAAHDVSLKELLRQMVDFALENMEKDPTLLLTYYQN